MSKVKAVCIRWEGSFFKEGKTYDVEIREDGSHMIPRETGGMFSMRSSIFNEHFKINKEGDKMVDNRYTFNIRSIDAIDWEKIEADLDLRTPVAVLDINGKLHFTCTSMLFNFYHCKGPKVQKRLSDIASYHRSVVTPKKYKKLIKKVRKVIAAPYNDQTKAEVKVKLVKIQ